MTEVDDALKLLKEKESLLSIEINFRFGAGK